MTYILCCKMQRAKCAVFLQMLKMASSMQKEFDTILSIFNARYAFFWPEIDRITLIMTFPLWRYDPEKKYQAPGWRHEDLVTLKMLLSRLMTMCYDCAKIERNWPNFLSYPLHKKVRKIKINNNNNNKTRKKIRQWWSVVHLVIDLIRHGDELGGLSSSNR